MKGFHFVGIQSNGRTRDYTAQKKYGKENHFVDAAVLFKRVLDMGYDAINSRGMALSMYRYYPRWISLCRLYFSRMMLRLFDWQPVQKYNYKRASLLLFSEQDRSENVYPTIIPNWDRSPRAGKRAVIWYNYNPIYFKEQVKLALDLVKDKEPQHKLIFLMSWNEWGEGNYMEPDLEYGHGYINALNEALNEL